MEKRETEPAEAERLAEIYRQLDAFAAWLGRMPRYADYGSAFEQFRALWRTLHSLEDEVGAIFDGMYDKKYSRAR